MPVLSKLRALSRIIRYLPHEATVPVFSCAQVVYLGTPDVAARVLELMLEASRDGRWETDHFHLGGWRAPTKERRLSCSKESIVAWSPLFIVLPETGSGVDSGSGSPHPHLGARSVEV